ncbi:MAG: type II toxin-antitoxin system RelE/ParE family toxin [Paludibacteraceae bacterium]|nr:type II toxin-antitoxin system RelE/ParE family toxin [Paludibacteraceae bacterium]
MNVNIKNNSLLELYNVGMTTNAEYSKIDHRIVKAFIHTINIIKAIPNLYVLKAYNGLRYEKLSKELSGFESLRVNDQWRIICKTSEVDNTLTITDISIHKLSKHYEK